MWVGAAGATLAGGLAAAGLPAAGRGRIWSPPRWARSAWPRCCVAIFAAVLRVASPALFGRLWALRHASAGTAAVPVMRIAQVLTASTGGIGRHVASIGAAAGGRGATPSGCSARRSPRRPTGWPSAVWRSGRWPTWAGARGADVRARPRLQGGWAGLAGRPAGAGAAGGELAQRRAGPAIRRPAGPAAAAAGGPRRRPHPGGEQRSGGRGAAARRPAAPGCCRSPRRRSRRPRISRAAARADLGVGGRCSSWCSPWPGWRRRRTSAWSWTSPPALRDRGDLRFAVVGEGPERPALAGRIAAEQLPVTLLGHRDDLGSLLAAADLALLTSTWEARALVAQEALLAGLPLVSTRVGGIAELVGDAAVLVEPGDARAAAEAVAAAGRRPGRAGPAGGSSASGRPPPGRTRTPSSTTCWPRTRAHGSSVGRHPAAGVAVELARELSARTTRWAARDPDVGVRRRCPGRDRLEARGTTRETHQASLRDRRGRLLARQGTDRLQPGQPSGGPRAQRLHAEAGPLSQRRPGHDEPVPARRGVRHRGRRGDRPRRRPLRALPQRRPVRRGQRHHRQGLLLGDRQGAARATTSATPCR